MLKSAVFFVVAVVDTWILTSIVSTQLVLADVSGFGLQVSIGDRVSATLHDLLGLAPALLPITGVGFLIAFTAARNAHRIVGGGRTAWFTAAGFVSLPAAMLIMKFSMGLTGLAAARTPAGLLLVGCCSLTGGWLYGYLSSRYGNTGGTRA